MATDQKRKRLLSYKVPFKVDMSLQKVGLSVYTQLWRQAIAD